MTKKTCRQHSCVVQDEQIAGSEQVREFVEGGIVEAARIALQVQHARGGAIRKRLLRNQLLGKVEIEFRNQHSPIIGGTPSLSLGELPKGGVVLPNCLVSPPHFSDRGRTAS